MKIYAFVKELSTPAGLAEAVTAHMSAEGLNAQAADVVVL